MSNKVYEIVTEQIIKQLENGDIPWKRPWLTNGIPIQNFVSKKPYRGINPFLLNGAGYACPYWVTFNQVKQLGGKVKKGEHGSMVVFFKMLEVDDRARAGEKTNIPMLRYYKVFNLSQTTGIHWDKPEETREHNPIQICEDIVSGYPGKPPIKFGRDHAAYNPSGDYVKMPNPETFKSAEFFYNVLFHELTHSTGHENRLDRASLTDLAAVFGSHEYSKEELVAEFGAAMLCGVAGIDTTTIENSAAYIKNWSKKLRENPKYIVWAASQAQKAADYIQDVKAVPVAVAA